MKRNEFKILYDVLKHPNSTYRDISKRNDISLGNVSNTLKALIKMNYINDGKITKKGVEVLKPYKVQNAIIMAAGMSTRFVPLSFEKPKGLLKIKGEILIERQINQLVETGIKDITIVLGYKKEQFYYLEDKYPFIKIVINPHFHIKNTIETLNRVTDRIGNTYLCSSDDYFVVNPFEKYMYESSYSSLYVKEKVNEWYMIPGKSGYVKEVRRAGDAGYIMMGHVYWDNKFSREFIKLIKKHSAIGDYDQELWEQLFADNIKKLPPMFINVYPNNVIFEFDSLDDVRKFDRTYIKKTHNKIMENIANILKCKEADIKDLYLINGGFTNISFHFSVKGKQYIYRHPGDGTDKVVSRKHEKICIGIAKKLDVDPTCIYIDEKEGWKISHFLNNARLPNPSSWSDTKRVISVLKKLHAKKMHVDWEFKPWERALEMERITKKKMKIEMVGFNELKHNVEKIYKKTINDGIKKQFCQCDTTGDNWLFTDGANSKTILTDWEYGGEADIGCDIANYIMWADWEIPEAIRFIKEYCGKSYNKTYEFHFLAYVSIIAYHWFVFSLYCESCGRIMDEQPRLWHKMAKKYSNYLVTKFEL